MRRSAESRFDEHFSVESLREVYLSKVLLSNATGIDNVNQQRFQQELEQNLATICRKIADGSYRFTNFKLQLISKGRSKAPRELSIPTIRDRVVFRALCEFLNSLFCADVSLPIPQYVVKDVKQSLRTGRFDAFIKLDVRDFFPSVSHELLQKRLRRRIRCQRILELIGAALATPSVVKGNKAEHRPTKGIPQGLSISNILAAIYLVNLERRYQAASFFEFNRYVDDLLVMCRRTDVDEISNDIRRRYKQVKLEIHDPAAENGKSVIGGLDEPFEYVGYRFIGQDVSVRKSTVARLMNSLVSIFTSYRHAHSRDTSFLTWRLNLRITGCVFQQKARGWLFFFSEINDEALLHRLDGFVAVLCRRFQVSIRPKKFVRTYYQISHDRYRTSYIPNFDLYDQDQMRHTLSQYFSVDTDSLSPLQVQLAFYKKIDRQVRDLLVDVQDLSA